MKAIGETYSNGWR